MHFVFCMRDGAQIPSNELARISRNGVGGTVGDMRKAQYHLAKERSPDGVANADFEAMAAHFSHAPSTAKQYYDLTRPTRNAIDVSEMINKNMVHEKNIVIGPCREDGFDRHGLFSDSSSDDEQPPPLSTSHEHSPKQPMIKSTWNKEDGPRMMVEFCSELAAKKMDINAIRCSPFFDYYVKERKFTEKQLTNKLQWLKKSQY
ncbi:hypothetical protein CAPTEDRAFT_193742 [Capitella teleta]|uniref:Uncharacterized protein n=1 Tax=Capitella teleta TaxID=283909 RepID=R7VBB6_CAPTE|nr:hypothetical protein CAPTEDRAFT_193742 [Capitella teleta]|eukprot:ELU15837.1 hypothetical protein CAPTEDRAFT_193742 [Capitella teleta]